MQNLGGQAKSIMVFSEVAYCGTVFKELFKDIDVLDADAKTEIAASSEKLVGRKVQKMSN